MRGAEKTWWRILARENDLDIVCNDSFSGSTVCNTGREGLPMDATFVNRMDKYLSKNFFEKNEINTMLLFGGTNDSWLDCPVGALKYSDWTSEELKCVLPAFCYILCKAKEVIENITVILNCGLKQEIIESIIKACKHLDIDYVALHDIDKENNHPTELGMKQIAEQVTTYLKQKN